MREQIDQLKSEVSIVDVISQYLDLQGTGGTYKGFCPFHVNTKTPAFTVFEENNNWHCFGCEEGGDVIRFVQLIEGTDFVTAFRKLAKDYNIPVLTNPKEMEKLRKVAKIVDINAAIAEHWHTTLLWKAPEVLDYLVKERRLTLESIERFKLGYAPKERTNAMSTLGRAGFTREEVFNAGIIKQRKNNNSIYDTFRDRIMFPIRTNGDIIGFGGRVTPDSTHPAKFINTSNTLAFEKRFALYGLGQAKKGIRRTSTAVIVEGYLDVVAMHQSGFDNTVAVMGTSVTEYHIRKLRDAGAEKIILLMDGDVAGAKAATTAAGKNLGASIYIATLPEGKDPDEVLVNHLDYNGKVNMHMILSKAKPKISYLIEYYKEFLPDAVDKGNLSKKIVPLIRQVENETEQAAYLEELANALAITRFRPNPVCRHCGKAHYTAEEQKSFHGK